MKSAARRLARKMWIYNTGYLVTATLYFSFYILGVPLFPVFEMIGWATLVVLLGIFVIPEMYEVAKVYKAKYTVRDMELEMMKNHHLMYPAEWSRIARDIERHLIICTTYALLSFMLFASVTTIWALGLFSVMCYLAHIDLRTRSYRFIKYNQ